MSGRIEHSKPKTIFLQVNYNNRWQECDIGVRVAIHNRLSKSSCRQHWSIHAVAELCVVAGTCTQASLLLGEHRLVQRMLPYTTRVFGLPTLPWYHKWFGLCRAHSQRVEILHKVQSKYINGLMHWYHINNVILISNQR